MNLKLLDPAMRLATVGTGLRLLATVPGVRSRRFFTFEGRSWTYRETYVEAMNYANWFATVRASRIDVGAIAKDAPLHVAIYQENTPEFLFTYFGAALSGSVVFGVNTGLRGDGLATVLSQAEIQLLITDDDRRPRIDEVLAKVPTLDARRVFMSDGEVSAAVATARQVDGCKVNGRDPLIVIYTSGTTSAPKGVPCSHMKLVGAGYLMAWRVGLRPSDVGYIALPMFHSNVWLLGVMPLMAVTGSFVLRRSFSASAFEGDVLQNGVTYMNYVGHPIHYVLAALETKYGDGDAVTAALSRHRDNRFRIAQGNGASAVDRQRLVRYLGMEHVYEIYGSTEAPITTVVQPGDPLDSVGEIKTADIMVLRDDGAPCPPAEVDAAGRITNYDEAVGEIVREIDADNVFFGGYYKNEKASSAKYRGGFYRSGDLGHVRVIDGKRYLYFDGRTDDWIRKDGENFSAENVCHHVSRYAAVELAAAYGVPSEVSDEKVMVAIQLAGEFDPQDAFDWLTAQQDGGGMDPKWMPDYIRVVESFPMSPTQKIIVRHLKRVGFDLDRDPEMVIYFRERGDTTYRRFGVEDLAALRARFEAAGRQGLLAS